MEAWSRRSPLLPDSLGRERLRLAVSMKATFARPFAEKAEKVARGGHAFAFNAKMTQTRRLACGELEQMDNRPGLTTLFFDTLVLSMTVNAVVAVRLTKIAFGVVDPKSEGSLMVAEKIDAAAEATFAAARSFAAGEPHHAAGRAVAVYKRRVERNLRRLTSG